MHVEIVSWPIVSNLNAYFNWKAEGFTCINCNVCSIFLLLWQSLSLMDVDEDASGYLEFIGEFKSLSNVIALIIVLSRMRLLISHLVFNTFIFSYFLPNVSKVLYCSFIFLYIYLQN